MGLVILSGSCAYLTRPGARDIIVDTVQVFSLNEMEKVYIHQLDGEENEEDG